MKIREILEAKELRILSEKKTKDGETMTILAPWIVADRKNKNGRLYPLNLLQREVARVQTSIKAGAMISSADHPFGAHTSLADASHIIRKLEIDKDGKGWMEATILPTTKGKNAMEILKAKGQLGISARGAGTISRNGTVGNDYRLLGIDIVTSPAEPDAVFNKDNVFESVEFDEGDENIADKEQAMYELLQASYGRALEGGFHADFDFYCELHENGLRKVMHLPMKDFNSEKKLTEEAVSARVLSFYQEAVQGGFKGDLAEWKEKFPQIVEMASEPVEKIVEKKEPEKPFKAKISWSEAQASGFTGTIAEYRTQHPDIELILPEPPSKPIVETLEQEAQRIFEGLRKANPNSSVTLESVRNMLLKEEEPKREKKIREMAIYRVNKSLAGSGSAPSQEMLEKMVAEEIGEIKKERELRKKKNWEAYKRLLS